MNYYYDCEFLEGTQKENFPISLFRKETKPTIDLISIGIVAEDGREYSAISKDFNLKEAWNRYDVKPNNALSHIDIEHREQVLRNPYNKGFGFEKVYWIRENVLKPIWREMFLWQECDYALLNNRESTKFKQELDAGLHDDNFTIKSLKGLLMKFGKSNKQIAEEIVNFIDQRYLDESNPERGFIYPGNTSLKAIATTNLNLYGHYSSYDHVALCWLFGKMIDLPKGFPMYTRDLKQMMDEKLENFSATNSKLDSKYSIEIEAISPEKRIDWIKETVKEYPIQENEHNALADARWNKKLHEFINSL